MTGALGIGKLPLIAGERPGNAIKRRIAIRKAILAVSDVQNLLKKDAVFSAEHAIEELINVSH
jgi:hypothetical protein